MSLTLVTAFFDLAKREGTNRRLSADYLKHGQYILSLPHPIVIYIDPEFFWFVWEERKKHKLLEQTVIIPIRLEDVPLYQHKDRVHAARQANPTRNGSPIKDSANYIITMWSKFHFLTEVATKNPFTTTHFGWIDFGLTHVASMKYAESAFREIADPVKLLVLKWFTNAELESEDYFLWNRGHIACGYMTGNQSSILRLCHLLFQYAMIALNQGYGPTDEQIMPLMIRDHPDLFTFYYGDYDGILSNHHQQTISLPTLLRNLDWCQNAGEYGRVIDIISAVTKGSPEGSPEDLAHISRLSSPEGFRSMIESYLLKKNYVAGIMLCDRMIEMKHNDWEARYLKGQCHEGKDEWDLALAEYFCAYQMNSERAEPFYRIAHHYRLNGKQKLGYFFGQQALNIVTRTPDDYPEIYYQIAEEVTICAYYTEQRHTGMELSNHLLLDRKTNSGLRHLIRQNMFFYLEPTPNLTTFPIPLDLPPLTSESKKSYRPLNPSIIQFRDGYLVNCRTVNYEKRGDMITVIDGTNCLKTRNLLVEYDHDLTQRRQWEMVDPLGGAVATNVSGLEDLRLFVWNNEVWFSTTCWFTGATPQILLCQLDCDSHEVKRKYLLLGPKGEFHPEKNWIPYIVEGKLYFIYSHQPYTILHIPKLPTEPTGRIVCHIHREEELKFHLADLRGSAPPIPLNDGYIGLTHEVITREKRYYIERWVWYDTTMTPKMMSPPFYFRHLGVEFSCGMVRSYDNQSVIVGLGQEDCEVYLAQIPISTITSTLQILNCV